MNETSNKEMKMPMLRLVAPAMFALLAGTCVAQSYPTKPLRVMVASVAGGPPDIIMRGFSDPLRQEFGQPVIIENVPQGDGIVAAQNLIRSSADGYNILMASAGAITVNPVLQANLPYEPQKDLAPMVMIAQFNSVFVVNAAVPAKSLKELIALAKAKPGSITFGTAGTPTTSNLYVEWFRHNQGIDFYNVPYKSNPQALQAVVAGEVQATVFAAGAAVAQARAGKARVLAIISKNASPVIPICPRYAKRVLILSFATGTGFLPGRAPPGKSSIAGTERCQRSRWMQDSRKKSCLTTVWSGRRRAASR